MTAVPPPFKIDRPGTFDVVADAAVASQQTQFEVRVDGTALEATVSSTGSYETFRRQILGQLTLEKSGEHKLEIVPDRADWQPLNIRSIGLVPVVE